MREYGNVVLELMVSIRRIDKKKIGKMQLRSMLILSCLLATGLRDYQQNEGIIL